MQQVERQIADPLAVEGSVEIPSTRCSERLAYNVHGIDFNPNHSSKARLARTLRIVAPASLPGGYSVGVPPDPIPNSAVKPDCADGTIA